MYKGRCKSQVPQDKNVSDGEREGNKDTESDVDDARQFVVVVACPRVLVEVKILNHELDSVFQQVRNRQQNHLADQIRLKERNDS